MTGIVVLDTMLLEDPGVPQVVEGEKLCGCMMIPMSVTPYTKVVYNL
jgi:hypothetical protein